MHAEHGGFSLRRRPDLPVQSGRQRGRPRKPCSGGMASSSGNAWVESWQFAPVSRIANGMPRPSQIKWRLLPRLARSVGFAPVCGPQKLFAPNNYQQPHETSRSGHYEKANSATRSESSPKFRHAANRVNAANKSCQNLVLSNPGRGRAIFLTASGRKAEDDWAISGLSTRVDVVG